MYEKLKALVNSHPKYQKEICPRCGKAMGNSDTTSRYADVAICDDCGMEESIQEFIGTPLPVTLWDIYQKSTLEQAGVLTPHLVAGVKVITEVPKADPMELVAGTYQDTCVVGYRRLGYEEQLLVGIRLDTGAEICVSAADCQLHATNATPISTASIAYPLLAQMGYILNTETGEMRKWLSQTASATISLKDGQFCKQDSLSRSLDFTIMEKMALAYHILQNTDL